MVSVSRRVALVSALLLSSVGVPVAAQSVDSGAYLGARVASGNSDYAAAARLYSKALASDPGNIALIDQATTGHVGLDRIDAAAPLVRSAVETGQFTQVIALVNTALRAAEGEWTALLADYESGQAIGPLFDGLARAWATLGAGDVDAAMALFDSVVETEGVEAFGLYHKALALASLGRFDEAEAIFGDPGEGQMRLSRRGVIARAEILSQLGRNDEAIALFEATFGPEVDAVLQALRERLEAGDTLPFETIRNARDGMAEVYHSIATALLGEATDGYTLVYARLTEFLRPDHVEATLLSADLLISLQQYDLAIEAFRKVPRDHPASQAAELGRAEALRSAGRMDASIEVLRQLIERYPDRSVLHISLGDALRQEERFAEARSAYDAAIASFREDGPSQWAVYFTRGIAAERTDDWSAAEADFRKALELNPDQPQVLNYLGYSWVEMGKNMDEALDMIQRAVEARPDSGYITDSLGWVFYKLGRYQDAVAPMERAVELEPVDPVLNDHLGDVYWAVGRYREAEFQWKRALSFADSDTSGEADPDRIRRKIEVGLDAVLAEEGAAPLQVANDGG